MTFLVGYKDGIGKVLVNENKLSFSPFLSLSGATYFDLYDSYIFSLSNHGISVFNHEKLIYEDTQFEYKPSHIHYVPSDKTIVSSCYNGGTLSLYSLENDEVKFVKTYTYSKESKIHQAFYSSILERLLVVNLGLDEVYVYILNNHIIQLEHTIKLEKNSGPRHLDVDDNGFIYVICEYSNDVYIFNKTYHFISKYKTLNHAYERSDSSAIRFSHDMRYLGALNRYEDYLTIFKKESSSLTLIGIYSTQGKHARDFNFSLDDTYVLFANRDTNDLTLFSHHEGVLLYLDTLEIQLPMMILGIK